MTYKIPSSDPAMEVVDVSAAMYDVDRRVYPKIVKRGKLDSMLEFRLKSKTAPVKNLFKIGNSVTSSKSKKRTIFSLPDHELRHLARQYVQGFHTGPQTKSTSWIYPSARPLFKTCWFFRTNCLRSLSAAALQLRILWASVRWEEIAAKTTEDGQHIQTTNTEIVATEMLSHRHVGRFSERIQYFERRVVIPLDVMAPNAREVDPSQSRTRRNLFPEDPKLSPPIVTEEWVDEDQVDLCLIRHYHERIERETAATPSTSTSSGSRLTLKPSTGQSPTTGKLNPQAKRQPCQTTSPHQTGQTPGTFHEIEMAESVSATFAENESPFDRLTSTKEGKRSEKVVEKTACNVQPVRVAPSTSAADKVQLFRLTNGELKVRGLPPGHQILRIGEGRYTIVPKFAEKKQTSIEPKFSRQQNLKKDPSDEESQDEKVQTPDPLVNSQDLPISASKGKRGRNSPSATVPHSSRSIKM